MKITRCLALTGALLAGAALATGFPKRIGLTASEARVCLPGDLLLPGADTVVDRGVRIDAAPSQVWRVIERAFEDEEESRVLAREEGSCLILSVPTPGFEDEGREGTLVFAILPLTHDRTLLHLRERHLAGPELPPAALQARLGLEAFAAMRTLLDIRRAASREGAPAVEHSHHRVD